MCRSIKDLPMYRLIPRSSPFQLTALYRDMFPQLVDQFFNRSWTINNKFVQNILEGRSSFCWFPATQDAESWRRSVPSVAIPLVRKQNLVSSRTRKRCLKIFQVVEDPRANRWSMVGATNCYSSVGLFGFRRCRTSVTEVETIACPPTDSISVPQQPSGSTDLENCLGLAQRAGPPANRPEVVLDVQRRVERPNNPTFHFASDNQFSRLNYSSGDELWASGQFLQFVSVRRTEIFFPSLQFRKSIVFF